MSNINISDNVALRAAIKAILETPNVRSWTVHGFGMIRCYLDDGVNDWRLNVWHSALAEARVSDIHDHPWDLKSFVISGHISNTRYKLDHFGARYDWAKIKTGEGGGMTTERGGALLAIQGTEFVGPGYNYMQWAEEIHRTSYGDGTVTLNYRQRPLAKRDPKVFWPAGTQWVDAKPRDATRDEVNRFTHGALANWSKVL